MAINAIPLIVGAPQRLSIALAGVTYQLTFKYLDCDQGGWVVDIAGADNTPLLNGVPLVTGADLLAQYGYLGIGGQLRVQTSSDPDAVPTFENLGDDGQIYFVTP